MSLPSLKVSKLSTEEYLAIESTSSLKHEFVAGEIFAMTGASDIHNFICLNIAFLIREHLRGTPCRVFMSDLKLKVDAADAYFYPDLMVSCEVATDSHYREHPKLVIEVLSDSTAKYDQQNKRLMVQRLDSLEEYVVVAQSCMDVRIYRREASGWEMSIYTDGALVPLQSIGLNLAIEHIYESVWD